MALCCVQTVESKKNNVNTNHNQALGQSCNLSLSTLEMTSFSADKAYQSHLALDREGQANTVVVVVVPVLVAVVLAVVVVVAVAVEGTNY